jgi:CRISPR-associated protein Cas1
VKGQFLPAIPAHGKFRLAQYETTRSPEKQTHIASALIHSKIFNQRRSLQRLSLSRDVLAATITHRNFGEALKKLERDQPDSEQILGIEGFASADFYSVWGRFLPEEFPFERRTRRPPHNPVNACLSFISTVLYQEMVTACFAAGLDPALGCLHATENDRWSLALDLMEPLRPVIVEALTLDLFSRNILDASHFEPQNGGIYLNHEGRNKLILQYEKRLERYFHSQHLNHRTTLRLILKHLPLLYKKHISDGSPFTPFKMN